MNCQTYSHPILWFQTFWRMQGGLDPYQRTAVCPCKADKWGLRLCRKNSTNDLEFCWNECGGDNILCLARSRFHLALAQMGKTNLTNQERQWLAPNDFDGGNKIISLDITNQIFVYDLTQLKEETLWEELASFLRVSKIPQLQYQGAKGKNLTQLDLCHPNYDAFRAKMMPYSYELSVWLQEYFLPVARDPLRHDVVVANVNKIASIFETYKQDPCGRLVVHLDRSRIRNGSASRPNIAFVLDPSRKQ
jgi:hypothetical protein